MIWWILLTCMVGAVVFHLASPPPPPGPAPWEDGPERVNHWERILQRHAQNVVDAGLPINPLAFNGLRAAMVLGSATALGLLLGPISAVCGGVAGWLITQEWLKSRQEGRLLRFADQFREALQSIANSLRAGRSILQALDQAYQDLTRVPERRDDLLAKELERLLTELRLGSPIDTCLRAFAVRVPLEEVRLFADAVLICRVRGGNLVTVLQTLIRLNIDRFLVRQEVRVQTAQKRGEGTLLSLLPVALLLINIVIAPDYMAPLTTTVAGQAVVGVGLLMVLLAFLITRAMTRIEV